MFHREFADKLGFDPPRTDCCNVCVNFKTQIRRAQCQQNPAIVAQLQADHQVHLELARKRRDDMNWDFRSKDVEDILLAHNIIEYDADGQIVNEEIIDHIFNR